MYVFQQSGYPPVLFCLSKNLIAASVLFDAVYVPDGSKSAASLKDEPDAIYFINEAFKHCKAIAADGADAELMELTPAGIRSHDKAKSKKNLASNGVLINRNANKVINAIAQHRFWEREKTANVLA